MYRPELIYFIILTVIVLFSQFLPTRILLLLDNFLVRIIVVLTLLYLTSLGPTAGILGLMAIAIMYLERNKRKVEIAAKKLDLMDWSRQENATIEEASAPQTTVPVNDFDKNTEDELSYIPENKTCDISDLTDFEPVGPSINQKAVLSTIPTASSSNKLYEELGFGHVNGLETVGN
jgi:hypothetical protein